MQNNDQIVQNSQIVKEDISFNHVVKMIVHDMFVGIIVYHFLAIFGLLLSLIMPLVWIFYPNRTFCVICLHQRISNKHDPYCKSCKRKVDSIYHPTLRSIIITTLVIFVISNISSFVFILEAKYLFKFDIPQYFLEITKKESAVMTAQQQFWDVDNNTVTFDVLVKTDKPINLVQMDLRFDKNIFKVKEIQLDKSFASIFTRNYYADGSDTINLVGGLPSPGFVGEGLFARVILERKTKGSSQLEFLSSSRVLANDGAASNLLLKTVNTTIGIR